MLWPAAGRADPDHGDVDINNNDHGRTHYHYRPDDDGSGDNYYNVYNVLVDNNPVDYVYVRRVDVDNLAAAILNLDVDDLYDVACNLVNNVHVDDGSGN
jgi:hypothetical protein